MATYGRIENGHNAPSLETLVRIAAALEVTVDEALVAPMSPDKAAPRPSIGRPMTGTEVVHWTPSGIDPVDRAVTHYRKSSLAPAQFKDKAGHVKVEDLALAAAWLYALDVPTIPNLPQPVRVIGGRGEHDGRPAAHPLEPGRLRHRSGGGERRTQATVRIRQMGGRWKPPVTVTMDQAARAGWTKRKGEHSDTPSNYELMPERMLVARACTKAISNLYARG